MLTIEESVVNDNKLFALLVMIVICLQGAGLVAGPQARRTKNAKKDCEKALQLIGADGEKTYELKENNQIFQRPTILPRLDALARLVYAPRGIGAAKIEILLGRLQHKLATITSLSTLITAEELDAKIEAGLPMPEVNQDDLVIAELMAKVKSLEDQVEKNIAQANKIIADW